MIQITCLTKKYVTNEIETTALNSLNLTIKSGEFLAIMGPSGCGKSTFLNILGLLDSPTDGGYKFLDNDISGLRERELAKIRKNNVGFIFQEFNLIDELTVFENIELSLLYLNIPAQERKKRVMNILKQVSIDHRVNHYPKKLSGGQQQRVAIARALVSNPKLLVADEPTGNLDSKLGTEIMEILTEINKQGTTVVMVTHSEHHANYADRILYLLDGKFINKEDLGIAV